MNYKFAEKMERVKKVNKLHRQHIKESGSTLYGDSSTIRESQ